MAKNDNIPKIIDIRYDLSVFFETDDNFIARIGKTHGMAFIANPQKKAEERAIAMLIVL